MSAYFVGHLLKGQRYLITGATGGAGSKVALEISRVGGICVLAVRDANKGERVLRELMGSGHKMIAPLDPAGEVIECGEDGPYDGWFDGIGVAVIKPLSQSFDPGDVLHANLANQMALLAGAGLRQKPLVKDGGSIVLMSSVAAVRGQSGMSLYCASKGAIEALTRAAAVELAPRRIRVNCIRAGAFVSPMHSRITMRATPEAIDEYAKRHLLGFGRPEDIAHAVLYLLSDAARWITGTALSVDGGYQCR